MFKPITPMVLMAALLLALAPSMSHGQQSYPPNAGSTDTVWDGQYACADGQSDFHLRLQTSPNGAADAVLEFHQSYGNAYGPAAALQMHGFIRQPDGFLVLNPVRWLSQPYGNPMTLTGIVSGSTYRGGIIGGYNCGGFIAAERSATAASYSQPPPPVAARTVPPPVDHSRSAAIPLRDRNGTLTVPVIINNAITLPFIVDSGASDVTVPENVVMALLQKGSVRRSDFLDTVVAQLADGSKIPSQRFRIRSLQVGDKVVQNVIAGISPGSGTLLLGQSFLSRFKSWAIDNQRRVLILD
jgi:hypothetical protein